MSTSNQVQYRRLGSSGLQVSVPIIGAMGFGFTEWKPWVLEEKEAIEVLKAAWDIGINTIDTANNYSNGGSELIVGKFIEQHNIPRNQIIIATKCYGLVSSDPSVFTPDAPPAFRNQREYINQHGLSRAAIFNQVEASLKRLKTSYIDLLQIHRYDADTPAEETMKALHDLVQSGKVRYLGASSMRTWQFAHLNEVAGKNGWTKFVSMQDEYSLLYREEEREMHAYCKFNGIGIIPWGPLCGGTLARPEHVETARKESFKGSRWAHQVSQADGEIIRRVQELAERRGVSMAQIALAWIDSKITSPIVGVSSIKRLEESILRPDFALTTSEMKYLEEPYTPREIRGHL
ncbi:Aldo/keto reductase [Marasmius fiardii PR-910]|nr:Aldo/keto reductase [Marasmius fiardii PR-910]